jgi:hypothetical protein
MKRARTTRRSSRKFVATKAVKHQIKLKLLVSGPSNAGKTWNALAIATYITEHLPNDHGTNGRIGFLDTEADSASLYADDYDFDVIRMEEPFDPIDIIAAMEALEDYAVVIVDSITAEWKGQGGCLERVDKASNRATAWGPVTQDHNAFINTILWYPTHLICCAREKQSIEIDNSGGKTQVRKIGLTVEQRSGIEYEFQMHLRLNEHHRARVDKTRCKLIAGQVYDDLTDDRFISVVWNWLASGEAEMDPAHWAELSKSTLRQWLAQAQANGWVSDEPTVAERQVLRSVLGDLYEEIKTCMDEDRFKEIQQQGEALIVAHNPSGL